MTNAVFGESSEPTDKLDSLLDGMKLAISAYVRQEILGLWSEIACLKHENAVLKARIRDLENANKIRQT